MLKGSCLCGGVAFEADAARGFYYLCHCSMYRKASGSAFAGFIHVAAARFRWLRGESMLQSYESSPGTRRNFCRSCGARLPSVDDTGRQVIVPVGTLDEDPALRPVVEIFAAEQVHWFEPVAGAQRYDQFPLPAEWDVMVGGGS